MNVFESHIFDDADANIIGIVDHANIGIWQFDVASKNVKWSVGFYHLLGYEPGEIECSYGNFVDNILYHKDKKKFLAAAVDPDPAKLKPVQVRLLTKTGFQWFEGTVQQQQGTILTGTFINIQDAKVAAYEAKKIKSKNNEAQVLGKFGDWEIEVATGKLTLSEEAFAILELRQQPVRLSELLEFFYPPDQAAITAAIDNCGRNGQPFDLDLKLKTLKENALWVKMKAVAHIDEVGTCVCIKGIIQDINRRKDIESGLRSSLDLVSLKNERLQNFTFIVSHNLRSYATNLQLMVNLHLESESERDRQEIFSHIKTISASLNTTVGHLNEIVKFEAEIHKEKLLVNFELLFSNIVNALQSNISQAEATVSADFKQCPNVLYIPAYLESIFHNLLTNALKYRDPERPAVITCKSSDIDGHVYLTVEDTGLGIDLARHGEKIFGMYQIFHQNKDAQGIGLFITRNQVEALGGSIQVESQVGVGTKFIVRLT